MAQMKKTAMVLFRSSPGLPAADVQLTEIHGCLRKLGASEVMRQDLGEIRANQKNCINVSREWLERHPVDMVVVWRLDCLHGLINRFVDLCAWLAMLESHDVELVVVGDGFRPKLSDLRFINDLLSIWKMDRGRLRAENARLSLFKAKARGTKVGRLKMRDDNAISVLRAFGKSIRQIAECTGVSPAAVQRSLRNQGNNRPEARREKESDPGV